MKRVNKNIKRCHVSNIRGSRWKRVYITSMMGRVGEEGGGEDERKEINKSNKEQEGKRKKK